MTPQVIAIFVYLAVQVTIGIVVSRRIANIQDYFIAGRSLGLGLATFSIFATWFGAETCMGSSAAIFQDGLAGSRADPFGYTICLLLMGLMLAGRLWRHKLTTLADLFGKRYSPFVEKLAVWIMVPSSLIWAAAQIRAFGHVLAISSNFSVTVGVTVAALVVIFYTLLGGMWGDVATDFIQGIVLILGMGLLMVAAVHSLGGLSETLSLIDPAKLNFVGAGEGKWQRLDSWMIPILGSLTAQELIARVISSRSANVARNASLSAAAIYLLVGLIPVWLGLLGSHFNLKLDDPDQFLPAIASSLLPSALFVVFCGALISAILSTVDSALLAVSALVANNIVVPLRGSNLSEPQKIWTARLVVLIAGVFAYVMALYAQGIYSLVEAASSFGSAGVLIITLFGLFSRFGGHWSASGALIAGLVTTPLAQYVWPIEAPFIVSIVVALLTYVLAELVRRLLVLQQSKRAAGVIGAPTKVFSK